MGLQKCRKNVLCGKMRKFREPVFRELGQKRPFGSSGKHSGDESMFYHMIRLEMIFQAAQQYLLGFHVMLGHNHDTFSRAIPGHEFFVCKVSGLVFISLPFSLHRI